jgi:protein-L-isoaspartate(D-aspartate) O-methyltransferase
MLRERMVETQIAVRGLDDPAVLEAMRSVPRHLFIPEGEQDKAYHDGPVAIGCGQTISQPYIVALMVVLARLDASSRVLEIGTGCGYQTAVLAACAGEIFSIELEAELAQHAAATLAALGVANVTLRVGDGARGWPEAAPFDAIVVSAAPADVPPALVEQLAPGGRLVIPVGTTSQELCVITVTPEGVQRDVVAPVRFVPLR